MKYHSLTEPKSENEKEYRENTTNIFNNTNEKIYNETVKVKEVEKLNLTDPTFIEVKNFSNIYYTSEQNVTHVEKDTNSNTTENNSTSSDETNSYSNSQSNESSKGKNETIDVKSSEPTNPVDNNKESQLNETSNHKVNTSDSNENNRLLQAEFKRNLEEKVRLISKTTNNLALVLSKNNDEFLKNLANIFLNFKYDPNESTIDLTEEDPDQVYNNSTTLDMNSN